MPDNETITLTDKNGNTVSIEAPIIPEPQPQVILESFNYKGSTRNENQNNNQDE